MTRLDVALVSLDLLFPYILSVFDADALVDSPKDLEDLVSECLGKRSYTEKPYLRTA